MRARGLEVAVAALWVVLIGGPVAAEVRSAAPPTPVQEAMRWLQSRGDLRRAEIRRYAVKVKSSLWDDRAYGDLQEDGTIGECALGECRLWAKESLAGA